jgi:hypothetical protein
MKQKLFGTIKGLIPEFKTARMIFGDQIPVTISHSLLRELMDELDDVPEPHKILFEVNEKGEMQNFEVMNECPTLKKKEE